MPSASITILQETPLDIDCGVCLTIKSGCLDSANKQYLCIEQDYLKRSRQQKKASSDKSQPRLQKYFKIKSGDELLSGDYYPLDTSETDEAIIKEFCRKNMHYLVIADEFVPWYFPDEHEEIREQRDVVIEYIKSFNEYLEDYKIYVQGSATLWTYIADLGTDKVYRVLSATLTLDNNQFSIEENEY